MTEKNGAGYNPAVEDVPEGLYDVDVEQENETISVTFSEQEVQELMMGDEMRWTVTLKNGKNVDIIFKQEQTSDYE